MNENKCRIGADELILRIRKYNDGNKLPNDQIQGLGIKIRRLIEELGGEIDKENYQSVWDDNDSAVNQFNLPKTSAQYVIDYNVLPRLYSQIDKL